MTKWQKTDEMKQVAELAEKLAKHLRNYVPLCGWDECYSNLLDNLAKHSILVKRLQDGINTAIEHASGKGWRSLEPE